MTLFFKEIIFLFFLIFTLSNNNLLASLLDHLKKCDGKIERSDIKGIDFIYMINLDKRPEKFALSSNALKKYDIHPYRFSAINGLELSIEVLNNVGLKYLPGMTSLLATSILLETKKQDSPEFMTEIGKTYFSNNMTRGSVGCSLSHISILKDAWDSGYETIWVLEDDIEIFRNPHILSKLIHRLDFLVGKENWDVLFTDPNSKGGDGHYIYPMKILKRPDIDCCFEEGFDKKYISRNYLDSHFHKIGARYGAYSMIIRRSGIKKLLDFAIAHQIFNPYDEENFLDLSLNRYSLNYDVVSTLPNAISDNPHQ